MAAYTAPGRLNAICLVLLGILLTAAGCATAPRVQPDADPVSMLPPHLELAFSLPLSEHRADLMRIVPELEDSSIQAVVARTARVVVGRTPPAGPGTAATVHIVAEGNFSATILRFGLREADGWTRDRVMGERWYHGESVGVVLLEPNLLYAVVAESPDLHVQAALLRRAGLPGGARSPFFLPGSPDAGRIWWSSLHALMRGGVFSIPVQLGGFMQTSGQFDYGFLPDAGVIMEGELITSGESAARALNVTLRFLLPQLVDGRPDVRRVQRRIQIGNIELSPQRLRELILPTLEQFL